MIYLIIISILLILLLMEIYNRNTKNMYTVEGYVNKSKPKAYVYKLPTTVGENDPPEFILPEDPQEQAPLEQAPAPPVQETYRTRQVRSMEELGIPRLREKLV